MKRTALLRKTKLKPVSKKRAKEMKVYAQKRKLFLEDRYVCERCFSAYSTQVHHKAKRGKNYLNESTWAALCAQCHKEVHDYPVEARLMGFFL